MDFSITNKVTVRGCPSLFQANRNNLLEMHTLDCVRLIQHFVDHNPCVELDEEYTCHEIDDGRLKPLEDNEMVYCDGSLLFTDRAVRKEPGDYGDPGQDFTESLELYLRTCSLTFRDTKQAFIWNALIDFIDHKGFLCDTPARVAESIGFSTGEVIEVLDLMKSVEPGGIGSYDLADFLKFQQRASGCPVDDALAVLLEHLDELAGGDSVGLGRRLGLSDRCVSEALDIIRSMRPYPAWGFVSMTSPAGSASPELVYYRRANGDQVLGIAHPMVKLNLMLGRGPGELPLEEQEGRGRGEWLTRLRDLEREALELAGLVDSRKSTILRVASFIISTQEAYLDGETEHKDPLTVSQVALKLDMPVSTASRAIKNITIATPRGTLPLRDLLARPVTVEHGRAVSRDYIQARITAHARRSDGRPRSDLQISNMLKSEGIDIARRTVNKYRRLAPNR